MFKKLLTDSEPEVSLACLQSLSSSIALISPKNLENLTNQFKELIEITQVKRNFFLFFYQIFF